MADNKELTASLRRFVQSLQTLAEFDTALYSKRLLQASKSTTCLQYFPHFQPADVNQQGTTFDGQDCKDHVNILAASSTARCLSNVGDDYGFHGAVDKNKALELSKSMIAKLISFMYGEHVNSHLKKSGVAHLNELRSDSDFVNGYHKLLLSSPFDHNALSQNVGRNFTIALLFCYEYFKHGPGFDLSSVLQKESEDMEHWVVIFRSWITHSQDAEFKKKNPNFRIESLIPSTGAVMCLEGNPDSNIQTLAQHLQNRVVGDHIRWEITEDIKQYQMLGQVIWASWDSATSNFETAVQAAVNDSKVTYVPGHSRANFPDPGYASQSFGETVDQYMQAFWATDLFISRANNRTRSSGIGHGGGCFKPGTRVLTLEGSKPIESLIEGDDVLTRGGVHKQWGKCSSEQVVHSTMSKSGRIQLFGFNGGSPFFSANHVFFTTTGLRALDPILAKTENPWLPVGRLQVGHSVVRTDDGNQYRPIQINNFSVEVAESPTIHGVHLREGLRSYHANGYLVHLNYPEITIKSISRLLSGIDPVVRHNLLQHLSELQPLFERFGAQTLMDAFERQLQDNYTDSHPLQLSPAQNEKSPLQNAVEHLRRGWLLQDEKGDTPDRGLTLPSVEVFEGVVTIDGSYCDSATVKGNLIAWSRRLPDIGWEHGFIRLDSSFMIGNGLVYYSPDFEAFNDSDYRRVIASPTKKNVPVMLVAENTITNSSVQSVLGGDGSGPMPLAKTGTFMPEQLGAALGEVRKGDSLTSAAGGALAEPESIEEMIGDTLLSVPMKIPDVSIMGTLAQINVGSLANSPANKTLPAQAQVWPQLDNYSVSYDKDGWSEQISTVSNPQPYCQLFTSIDDESKTYLSRIPELDAIRDAAFADAQNEEAFADVAELYVCRKSRAPVSGDTVYEFRCTNPQLIAQLADDFDHNAPRFDNLTFKNLGLDIQLPFIFSVMQVKFSFDAQELTGILRAFDPSMIGQEGTRFRLAGQYNDTPETIVRATLANSTVGSTSGASMLQMTSPHLPPPSQLLALSETPTNQVPTQDEIGAKQLYDMALPDIHEQTQRLIYNTMRYHMTVDDHKAFIGLSKPEVGENSVFEVPKELGPDLESGTRKWLQEKYTPAWISIRICQIADLDKDHFRKSLSNSQRKKLDYWWHGKGPQCMTRSDYYNRLNALAARYATLWAIPPLQAFKNDSNTGTTKPVPLASRGKDGTKTTTQKVDTTVLTGGKRWAAALYNLVGVGPKMHELATELGDLQKGSNNPLQRFGNILQVLDPIPIAVPNQGWTDENSPYSIRLTENVRRYTMKLGLTMPYCGSSSTDPFIQNEYQFIHDALGTLWTQLMEQKAGFDDEITAQIRKDLKEMQELMGIDQQWEVAKKAQLTLEFTQEMIISGATFARANADFKITEKIDQKWHGWRGRGAAAAVATADYAMETQAFKEIKDEFKAARLKSLMYSSMALATLGMYIGVSIAAFKNWKELVPADRAKLILGAIQQAVHTLGASHDAYKLFLDYKAGKRRFVAAAALEQSLTQDMRVAENQIMNLFGEEHAIHPDLRLRNAQGDLPPLEAEARQVNIEMSEAHNRAVAENVESPEKPLGPDNEHGANGGGVDRRYNWKGNAFKIALFALGAALVVAECFSIYQNWGHMDKVTAGMSIANVVVQALSVVVEGIILVADIGFSVASGLLTVCSFAGPILAIVGIVLMFVMMIIVAVQPRPFSPSEKWMDDSGFKFVNNLPDAPVTRLSWSITPEKFTPESSDQSLTFTGTNKTSSDVELKEVRTSFTSGTSKSSLFSDDGFKVPDMPTSEGSAVATGRFECKASSQYLRSSLNFAQLKGDPVFGDVNSEGKADKQTTWQLFVKPKLLLTPGSKTSSNVDEIVMKPGEWISITVTGKIGEAYANPFYADVIETTINGDTIPESRYITRDGK